ncbi:ABC transporter ATP-binding protein [Ignavigranum ruoffiae]|uniref:ABC transporter ATP-binding protein n=1 Tax=Ignavigranum ruoffiae TaxID=89093 RepID=UPI00204FC7B4|nr:ABC transporter ATP-binding protein [Ignavigranum ruoffiae]UPQ85541.1 ABC transporter ATP-binding protein [Ignavigranum ruoffiae]
MTVIEVKQLAKSFHHHLVLKDINFTIDQPEIVALVGPNGSGKSTLLNIMVNLLNPSSGYVKLLDQSVRDYRIFNQVSFLKDNSILYPYLTGWDHLTYAGHLYRLSDKRLQEAVTAFKMTDYIHRQIQEYSLGMKQKMLLALATLNQPKIMILDEPFNGLDPQAVIETRQLFKQLHQSGTTILLSSHTLSEIDKLTRHILFLKDGQILEEYLDQKPGYSSEQRYLEIYPV